MSEYKTPEPGVDSSILPSINATVYPARAPGPVLAQAKVEVGGLFVISNIRIMDSRNGPFMSMPRIKGSDGQFHDACYPITSEMRTALNSAVMDEFQRLTERTSVRGTLQAAAREAAARPAPEVTRTRSDEAR